MKIINIVILAFILCTSLAQAKTNKNDFSPIDSSKDLEVKIARLFKENLKLNPTLNIVDKDTDDLRVAVLFEEDEKQELPKIVAFADTKIWKRKKTELSQVISIYSTAEIPTKTQSKKDLLEWTNQWNLKPVPIRTQVVNGNIIAMTNLLTSNKNPVNKEQILQAFVDIIQVWKIILPDLKKNQLIP